MKKVNAIIERSSTGRYSIYMEDDTLPYLITGEGATLEEALDALSPLGIAGFGCNCGIGPSQMLDHLRRLSARTNLPLIISPNAGLPRYQDGETVYDLTPEVFARHMRAIAAGGARVLGGCCGTTPAHIRAMIAAVTED